MKKAIFILFIFVLLVAMVGCSNNESAQEGQGGEESKETLVVGTSADFPPFESIDTDGKIVGFDVDLVSEIAKELGMDVKIENITFDGLVDAVKTKKIDMAISGMNPTPDRLEEVAFSEAYYYASQTILLKEEVGEITKMEELVGETIGSQLGSTSDEVISQYEGIDVQKYDLVIDAVQDLKNGRIAGVIVEDAVAAELVTQNEGVKVVIPEELKVDAEPYGMVVEKENQELLEKVNTALQSIIDSGKYDELLQKHGLENTLK